MSALAGTGALVRHILRRDRIRLLVWIVAMAGLMVSFATSSVDLYPTPESLQARALIMDSPLGIAFSGPRIGLDNYTFGAMLANEYVGFVAVAFALMSVFLVVRKTRVEEQSGRAELIRANEVGRHAPATSALLVVVGAQLLIGIAIALLLPGTGLGLSTAGSWLFTAAIVSVGVVFAAIALILSQVSSHSRTAAGFGAAVVGLAYVIRAMGDVADSSLSMLSPIGWAQATRPFVDDTWWPLLLSVGAFTISTTVAFALSARRDFGEGLVAARPGPARGTEAMGRPFGLALRLQRGLLIGWGVGLLTLGLTYGGFVVDVERFAAQNPFIEEAMSSIGGGSLAESWASFLALFMMGLVASYSVQAILRLRSEEAGLRAEPVLATPTARWQWMGSHLLVAGIGSVVMAVLVGVGFGLSAAAATGDWGWVTRSLAGTLSHLPSLLVIAGFTVALVGLLPRFTGLAWAMVTVIWLGLMGVIIGLPEWISDISPFGYGALVPAADVEVMPLVVLTLIAVVLTVAGLVGFQRRDIRAV